MATEEPSRSVIEWSGADPDVLFYRWSGNAEEIERAAKLVVGSGQGCLFVLDGRVRTAYRGSFDRETSAVPFWNAIRNVLPGCESGRRVAIFFYRRARAQNVRWSTQRINYLDPIQKFPVNLSASGHYSLRIVEPVDFFERVVGAADGCRVVDLEQTIRARIAQALASVLGRARFSCVGVSKHRHAEIAAAVNDEMRPFFRAHGFELRELRLEETTFDEETHARFERIFEGRMHRATCASAIDLGPMRQVEPEREPAPPPPPVVEAPRWRRPGDVPTALLELRQLFDTGLIEDEEYGAQRQELLERL